MLLHDIFSIKTRLLKIVKRTRDIVEYREITFRIFHMRNNIDGNAFLNRQADHVSRMIDKTKKEQR